MTHVSATQQHHATATQRHRANAITQQHGSQCIVLLPYPVTYRTDYQDMETYCMDYPSQRTNGVSLL